MIQSPVLGILKVEVYTPISISFYMHMENGSHLSRELKSDWLSHRVAVCLIDQILRQIFVSFLDV